MRLVLAVLISFVSATAFAQDLLPGTLRCDYEVRKDKKVVEFAYLALSPTNYNTVETLSFHHFNDEEKKNIEVLRRDLQCEITQFERFENEWNFDEISCSNVFSEVNFESCSTSVFVKRDPHGVQVTVQYCKKGKAAEEKVFFSDCETPIEGRY